MSTTETAIIPTYRSSSGPIPTRRPILRPGEAARDEGAPFADWRDRTPTEEQAAVTARAATLPRRAPRRTGVRSHLRCALVGTLLAIVAITGLSAYAAAGITEARSTALCQAHISCK